jgi:methylmalonyl-CoA mutase
MERQYQRTRIQEESLYYERMKESGAYPIVGVNTFLSATGSPFQAPDHLIRSTDADKDRQISNVAVFERRNEEVGRIRLTALQKAAVGNMNLFAELMETVKVASLGQITEALYAVGGRYRRNM